MNLDGPIISHSDARTLFTGGQVYRAKDPQGPCCYADNAADLEPYKAQGWTIEQLQGETLAAFLADYRAEL